MRRRIIAVAAIFVVVGSFLFVSQAGAQQAVEPSVVADAECAPDGATQGIVLTFINGNVTALTITGATASGSLLPTPLTLTFSPTSLSVDETATADFAFPGTDAGDLEISVEWEAEDESAGSVDAAFDVTACVQPTTTSTAAPAVAAETAATFTG